MTTTKSMTPAILRPLATLTLVLTLAACGDDAPPPEPAVEAEPAPVAATPAPPPAPTQAPTVAPDGHLSPPAQFTSVVPVDAIGGTPVNNVTEAYTRGNAALDQWLVEHKMKREDFVIKQTARVADHYEMMAFGAPGGEGMYVTIKIYDDGHADLTRQ